jgi:hypothetical protein
MVRDHERIEIPLSGLGVHDRYRTLKWRGRRCAAGSRRRSCQSLPFRWAILLWRYRCPAIPVPRRSDTDDTTPEACAQLIT